MERVLQFILSLSILIVLHELGHFIPARLFKTRVEKFYLFFDVKFSLFKKKIGDTVYGIGWLPLGGYVKIAGMVDESMDTDALNEPPKPWEFRAKPAWQRLIIITGGVIVNFILGILIYSGIMAYYGEEYLPADQLTYGIEATELGKEIGFENGDKIISINGEKPTRFSQIPIEMVLAKDGFVEVDRNGQNIEIPIDGNVVGKLIENKYPVIIPRMPYVADEFTKESPAKVAGVEKGDYLVGMNGKPMMFMDEFAAELNQNIGQEVTLNVDREGQTKSFSFVVPEDGKMGIYRSTNLSEFFTLENVTYSGFSALGAGFRTTKEKLGYYVRQFSIIFSPETGAYKEVGGFVTIAKQFDESWNWRKFWEFTAFLSLMLGFLNILPIPALDGGHMMFIVWEMITGKQPSTKFLEYAQMVGFFLLMGLIVLANGNDILKLFS